MAEKRRLPVLKSDPEPDEPPRPPWHWVGFGLVAIFGAWLPLAYVAEAAKQRVLRGLIGVVENEDQARAAIAGLKSSDRVRLTVAVLGLPALALAIGALAGGYLVGRYSERAGIREAVLAGALAGVVSGGLALAGGAGPTAFLPLFFSALFAGLGAHLGVRRRAKPGL